MLPTAQKLYLSEMATLLGRDRQRLGPTEYRRKASDRLNCDDVHNGLFALACALVFRLHGAPMQFAEVHKILEASPFGTWKCARALLEMHRGAARPPPASLTFHLREIEHELQESLAWADPQVIPPVPCVTASLTGSSLALPPSFDAPPFIRRASC